MSPAAAHPQGSPPGDEELTALYHQVLIGFAEESPTSEHSSHKLPSPGERDYERAYNQYINDGNDTSRSMQTKTGRSPQPVGTCSVMRDMKPDAHTLRGLCSSATRRSSIITKKLAHTRRDVPDVGQTVQAATTHPRLHATAAAASTGFPSS